LNCTEAVTGISTDPLLEVPHEINRRYHHRNHSQTNANSYAILLESWDEDKLEFVEQFKVLLLNRANKVLGIYEVSTGGVSGTVADPKLVFAAAINANASDDPFP
jgi:DNA repair protein RadC